MHTPLPTALFFGAPGTPEILVILLAVLLLFGAKRLPQIARSIGKSMEQFRRTARDVTDDIMQVDLDSEPPPIPSPLPSPEPADAAATPEKKQDTEDPSDDGRA